MLPVVPSSGAVTGTVYVVPDPDKLPNDPTFTETSASSKSSTTSLHSIVAVAMRPCRSDVGLTVIDTVGAAAVECVTKLLGLEYPTPFCVRASMPYSVSTVRFSMVCVSAVLPVSSQFPPSSRY